MKEKTFVGTLTAIMLVSVPIWTLGLVCSGSVSNWSFLQCEIFLVAIFWIPLSVLTFIAFAALNERCSCRPALLIMAAGIVPFAMLSTFFLLDGILPVLVDLFEKERPAIVAAFSSIGMLLQALYVACSYIVAGGWHRDGLC